MSKTKQNKAKSDRPGYDLWGRRPMSGHSHTPENKKRCRRIERKKSRVQIKIYKYGYETGVNYEEKT